MFRTASFLRSHSQQILNFYKDRCIDPKGGYYQNFYDSGEVFGPGDKHLVSSTRMMFNFYQGYAEFAEPWMLEHAGHGYEYLMKHHWVLEANHFVWLFADYRPKDLTQYCYGYAFVILALAAATRAGEVGARQHLYATWELWKTHFWLPEQGLFADEITADWKSVSSYRGQNANMHACEALLFAYEVTGDEEFLQVARHLAQKFTGDLCQQTDGLVWEHYREDLSIDWDYNRDDPRNLYKPWGFQPGHQTEWSKLLLTLNRHLPEPQWVMRAEQLFKVSMKVAWDQQYGGLFYGFAPDRSICDSDKYFWVQAESFAAAAMLARVTGEDDYWQEYDRLWDYCWQHFIDHEAGAWYRLLNHDNVRQSNRKSEAGAKCDYHSLNACLEALRAVRS